MQTSLSFIRRSGLAAAAMLFSLQLSAQTEAERSAIVSSYDEVQSRALQQAMGDKYSALRAQAQSQARIMGIPTEKTLRNGTVAQLQRFAPDGTPIYYQTNDAGAAKTTRANTLNTNGGMGLSVNGQNMTVGVWDGGALRTTHVAFSNRAFQMDGITFTSANGNNAHANHVAGTMVSMLTANNGVSRGMAYEARINGYDWNNDVAEATQAAANGLILSNHSYGYGVVDETCALTLPLHWVGKYDQTAVDWDNIMYNYPYYQQVNAAGNDRECQSTINNKGGYDLLTGHSCAKNAIVVAAVNEVSNYTSPSSVVMSTFSNWGPTDDGRIKPDISAKGVNVSSINSSGTTGYTSMSGTSMASPNATGTMLLIQQHYKNVRGSFMFASMLRGLVLHTADEAGTAAGPDYRFGWGLLNAKRAAEVINATINNTALMNVVTITNGGSYTITVTTDGTKNLEASICWTDPAGAAITNSTIDDATRALRNDIDVRITRNGTTYMPWILNPASPATAATTGDNTRDNIEKIFIGTAPAGVYTITITHKGTSLVGSSQRVSLIASGITAWGSATAPAGYCTASGGNTAHWIANVACSATSFTNPSTQAQSTAGYTNYTSTVRNLATGANVLTLTPGFSSTASTYYWSIWVDFNNDNDFTDAGEKILTFSTGNRAAITQTVTIPSTALSTTCRMRVLMSTSTTMNPCGTFTTGEVEDYSVRFVSPPTTPPTTPTYCASNGTTQYEWIGRVATGTFANASTQAQSTAGYTNYSNLTITMPTGSNTLALTPGFAGTAYSEYWGVWVDFNNDADFADAGEQLFASTTGSTAAINAAITIPSTAAGTTRRMRIVMSDNATLAACGTYAYGETEDYTVTFAAPTNNTAPPTGYCAANGNSVVDEWIDYVEFGGMSNTTGANGGYGNFTATRMGTLQRGSTSTFRYSAGFSGTAYTEAWAIFIDFNRDGDFADAGEQVVNTTSSSAATLATNVTIPATASIGQTRVRVIARYKTAPTACGAFDYGEVEDYLLNITAAGSLSLRTVGSDTDSEWLENNNAPAIETPFITLMPNPTAGDMMVFFERFSEPKDYQILTLDGKAVATGRIETEQALLPSSQLPAGIYFIRFSDKYNTWTERFVKTQ